MSWQIGDIGIITKFNGRSTTNSYCRVTSFSPSQNLRLRIIQADRMVVSSDPGSSSYELIISTPIIETGESYIYDPRRLVFIRGNTGLCGSCTYITLTKWTGQPVKDEWLSD